MSALKRPLNQNEVTASFYKFVNIVDACELKSDLTNFCTGNAIIGTIVIAEEGINGSVAGNSAAIAALLQYVRKRLQILELIIKDNRYYPKKHKRC